jgi:hypothetical protein
LEVLYFAWLRERIGAGRERIATDAADVRPDRAVARDG